MKRRARWRRILVPSAFLSLALASLPVFAVVPPDDGLTARQAAALAQVAAGLVPFRPYPGTDREDCVIMSTDGMGVVARLELDRRGLPGGADPASAEPWVRHIAEAIPRLYGTGGEEGRWNALHLLEVRLGRGSRPGPGSRSVRIQGQREGLRRERDDVAGLLSGHRTG